MSNLSLKLRLTHSIFSVLIWMFVYSPSHSQDHHALVFQDIEGKSHRLPSVVEALSIEQPTLVLVFINTDCPIANAYHPTLTQLHHDFKSPGFEFIMIHADPNLSIDAAKVHQREYDIRWAVALDPEQQIAKRASAKVTPEAIVIDKDGKIVYRGRIDDRYADYGKKRPLAAREDLRLALEALVHLKPIVESETKAIGCVIRYHNEAIDKN